MKVKIVRCTGLLNWYKRIGEEFEVINDYTEYREGNDGECYECYVCTSNYINFNRGIRVIDCIVLPSSDKELELRKGLEEVIKRFAMTDNVNVVYNLTSAIIDVINNKNK